MLHMKVWSRSLVVFCLFGACFKLSTGVANAGVFTVVNVRTNAAWQGVSLSFPSGITSFDLAAAPASLIASLGSEFGVEVDSELNWTVDCTGPRTFTIQASPGRNLWYAFGGGMGVGFMWFGFGWCYRLAKKVGEVTDF